ncbi:hypothetical protein AB0875_29535 [Micromonospora gifhornensis]|uniref:hypothetical protein n=1 Tax=Micromonospora gifhornensis TaxID=84594 RepID=UPI0034538598
MLHRATEPGEDRNIARSTSATVSGAWLRPATEAAEAAEAAEDRNLLALAVTLVSSYGCHGMANCHLLLVRIRRNTGFEQRSP